MDHLQRHGLVRGLGEQQLGLKPGPQALLVPLSRPEGQEHVLRLGQGCGAAGCGCRYARDGQNYDGDYDGDYTSHDLRCSNRVES